MSSGSDSRHRPSVGGGSTSFACSAASPSSSRKSSTRAITGSGSAHRSSKRIRRYRSPSSASPVSAASRFTPFHSSIARGGVVGLRRLRAEEGVGVLSRLVLVLREGHVAPVPHDVHEPQAGQRAREKRHEEDAARLLPAPAPALGRRPVALEQRSELAAHLGLDVRAPILAVPEIRVDPPVVVLGDLERVLGGVQVRADEQSGAARDARHHACPRAAGRTHDARGSARRIGVSHRT